MKIYFKFILFSLFVLNACSGSVTDANTSQQRVLLYDFANIWEPGANSLFPVMILLTEERYSGCPQINYDITNINNVIRITIDGSLTFTNADRCIHETNARAQIALPELEGDKITLIVNNKGVNNLMRLEKPHRLSNFELVKVNVTTLERIQRNVPPGDGGIGRF